jgi:hypothetical protein
MLRNLFTAITDGFRYRFGRQSHAGDDQLTNEQREALAQHNDAEARVVGRTMGDPNSVRAFGKGRPR